MKKIFKNNGLSITLLLIFFLCLILMSITGLENYNNEQQQHGNSQVDYVSYLSSGNFKEALMENMESEFLQMFIYILFTAFLYQKGSAESKKIDEEEPVDRDPRAVQIKKDTPWPVKKGGLILKIYENSLSLAFLLLFLISLFLHAVGGVKEYNSEELSHGGKTLRLFEYFKTSRFWFESLQNWQSEFFSIALMVLLSIFLRQLGSPESKPVDSPNFKTGSE
jgi:hypothetical protein